MNNVKVSIVLATFAISFVLSIFVAGCETRHYTDTQFKGAVDTLADLQAKNTHAFEMGVDAVIQAAIEKGVIKPEDASMVRSNAYASWFKNHPDGQGVTMQHP